jgi:hypothetical protein
MSTSALMMMMITQGSILVITVALFIKVLKTPPKVEPDSYSENDDISR